MHDYSLHGESGETAVRIQLADTNRYQTPLSSADKHMLVQRNNETAYFDVLILFGLMFTTVAFGAFFWGSWRAVPFWFVYGVLYGSAMDSRWNACVHGTAFHTAWMNQALYQVTSFIMVRNPVVWRWKHIRHHADTLIVGRDPQIVVKRPPPYFKLYLNVFGLVDGLSGWGRMIANASGSLNEEELSLVPEAQRPMAIRIAGLWAIVYALTFIVAVVLQSVLPLMVVGLPRFYGAWHATMTGFLQHAGLAENVVDYRLNTRTVYMNRLNRFICLNNNYHLEHHMYPMVPFHKLRALHEKIKHDVPAPDPSIRESFRRVLPVLSKQRHNQNLFLRRKLPPTAQPYNTKFMG